LTERDEAIVNQRVIFLDIDGVLAPIRERDRYGELDPACVCLLSEIVGRSGAAVVVTSSLRFGRTVAELQELLEAYGFRGRVIDKTPTDLRGSDRGEEIGAWLREHPVAGCVILDDHRDMGELLGYLVQTDAVRGLQPADVDLALEKLARDMRRSGPGACADPAWRASR
jgi:hypothetical protein